MHARGDKDPEGTMSDVDDINKKAPLNAENVFQCVQVRFLTSK